MCIQSRSTSSRADEWTPKTRKGSTVYIVHEFLCSCDHLLTSTGSFQGDSGIQNENWAPLELHATRSPCNGAPVSGCKADSQLPRFCHVFLKLLSGASRAARFLMSGVGRAAYLDHVRCRGTRGRKVRFATSRTISQALVFAIILRQVEVFRRGQHWRDRSTVKCVGSAR